ncbi:hypothetical protein SteCoe_37522 [Stentor coeruleus]|uniref:Uncharacterized protein n=1 Tax=Stentor coeruleus TaxID=5963 RepID=A0A1R2AMU7_9CILI|nr:hypothetical protein SteCoe_37522 [Stentor coeruleus]
MEFKSILDSVSKLRKNLQDKRNERNYSRSISPRENQVSALRDASEEKNRNLCENFKPAIGIPASLNEMLEKYNHRKCPLPRPQLRQKAYKQDAAELMIICISKVLKKLFLELKPAGFQKKPQPKNPIIIKYSRGRSASESERTEVLNTSSLKNNMNLKVLKLSSTKKTPKSLEAFLTSCLKVFAKKLIQFAFRRLKRYDNIDINLKFETKIRNMLKKRLIYVFNGLIGNICPKKEIFKFAGITTPKFFNYGTPKAVVNIISTETKKVCEKYDVSNTKIGNKKYLSQTPKAELQITPGKIVKTSLIRELELEKSRILENEELEEKPALENEDFEQRPTFGRIIKSSRPSIEELKYQKNQRTIEIHKNLEELEQSIDLQPNLTNPLKTPLSNIHTNKDQNSSKEKFSLFSSDLKTLPQDNSDGANLTAFDISPIKIKNPNNLSETTNAIEDSWNHSHLDITENYEEMSLKSFVQHSQNISFDKDSLVKNMFLNQNYDAKTQSFNYDKNEHKVYNKNVINLIPNNTFNSERVIPMKNIFENKLSSKADSVKRKRIVFIARLEVLSRLEDKFTNKFSFECKDFYRTLWFICCEKNIENMFRIFQRSLLDVWYEIKTFNLLNV